MVEIDPVKAKQLAELQKRRARARGMGGAAAVAKQKKKGKLTARERIELLLDKGSFQEIGMFAKNRNISYGEVVADGIITGYGEINGRRV